jgi:hypothetical protein
MESTESSNEWTASFRKQGRKFVKMLTALPALAKAYKGLIIRQNEIYDSLSPDMEKIHLAQFEKHSNIVIPFQVFGSNVQAAIVDLNA